MWSQWPWVSSTRRTPRRRHSSSSCSCSFAASSSTASPVARQRTTNTLFSYGPTTTLWTSTSVFDQCSVSVVMWCSLSGGRADLAAVPAIGALHDVVEPVLRLPSQRGFGHGRIGECRDGIAGAAADDVVGHRGSGDARGCFDHVEY